MTLGLWFRLPCRRILFCTSGPLSRTVPKTLLNCRLSSTPIEQRTHTDPGSVLDFDTCHAYLCHYLNKDSGAAVPSDGSSEEGRRWWGRIVEEITDTLPAHNREQFSPEAEVEGTARRKLVAAKKRAELGARPLRPHMRDAFVLSTCLELLDHKAALSFRDFMRAEDRQLTPSQMETVLKLLSKCENLDELDDPKALDLCSEVEEATGMLGNENQGDHRLPKDSAVALRWHVLGAMANTSKWRQAAKEALENRSSSTAASFPSSSMGAFKSLSYRALREGDFPLWRDIIRSPNLHQHRMSIAEEESPILEELSLRLLRLCEEKTDDTRFSMSERLTDLFEYFRERRYFVPDSVVKAIKALNSQEIVVREAKVTRGGYCIVSKTSLPKEDLSEEELEKLLLLVEKNVLIRSDIYIGSNPEEFQRFISHVESNKTSYDVVVDGLNAAMHAPKSERIKSSAEKGRRLLEVVLTLTEDEGLRVLLLGRSHMRRYRHFKDVARLCKVMLFDNVSEDDPFLLVAALKCSAFVLSNDALRQHVAKLKTAEQRRLFYRWQEQKQLRMHSFREARTGGQLKSKLIWPPRHSLTSCLADGTWHIPVANEKVEDYTNHIIPPEKWLCVTLDSDQRAD